MAAFQPCVKPAYIYARVSMTSCQLPRFSQGNSACRGSASLCQAIIMPKTTTFVANLIEPPATLGQVPAIFQGCPHNYVKGTCSICQAATQTPKPAHGSIVVRITLCQGPAYTMIGSPSASQGLSLRQNRQRGTKIIRRG